MSLGIFLSNDSHQVVHSKINPQGSDLKPIDANFLIHLGTSDAGVSALCAALQVALGISPISLLHSSPLDRKKGFDRKQLINMWIALGTEKPALLAEVENMIWRALFDVVVGTSNPFDALDTLRAKLPWDTIDNMNEEDDAWFVLSKQFIT